MFGVVVDSFRAEGFLGAFSALLSAADTLPAAAAVASPAAGGPASCPTCPAPLAAWPAQLVHGLCTALRAALAQCGPGATDDDVVGVCIDTSAVHPFDDFDVESEDELLEFNSLVVFLLDQLRHEWAAPGPGGGGGF